MILHVGYLIDDNTLQSNLTSPTKNVSTRGRLQVSPLTVGLETITANGEQRDAIKGSLGFGWII